MTKDVSIATIPAEVQQPEAVQDFGGIVFCASATSHAELGSSNSTWAPSAVHLVEVICASWAGKTCTRAACQRPRRFKTPCGSMQLLPSSEEMAQLLVAARSSAMGSEGA